MNEENNDRGSHRACLFPDSSNIFPAPVLKSKNTPKIGAKSAKNREGLQRNGYRQ